MWPDNETTQDLLGFQTHADLIRRLVTDSANLPCTVGLFGDWGGGKSSVLRMLERDFDPDNIGSHATSAEKETYGTVACLYFNGWLFEGYDDARAALLSSILKQLSDSERFGVKVKKFLGDLPKSVDLIRAGRALAPLVVPLIARSGMSATSAVMVSSAAQTFLDAAITARSVAPAHNKKSAEKAATMDTGTNAAVRQFRGAFSDMLKNSSIDTLIVLVDDLDRCSPEHMIDNLEAIKLFLSVPGTAFVIGADDRLVRSAIEQRYGGTGGLGLPNSDVSPNDYASELARDYLEKMIQVPYRLPRLFPSEVTSYMTLLHCMNRLPKEKLDRCIAASIAKRRGNTTEAFSLDDVRAILGNDTPDELRQDLQMVEASAPTLSSCLKGNPRQVKRFLNMLDLRLAVAVAEQMVDIKRDMLAKLMTLEYYDVFRFRQVYQWYADANGTPRQIESLERAIEDGDEQIEGVSGYEDWLSSSFLKRWLSSDPPVGSTDLRPYFWLSRDRLDVLAGVRGVSAQVRKALRDILSDNGIIQQRGLNAIKDLPAVEKTQLGDLVVDNLRRHPESAAAFESVTKLAEKKFLDGPAALEQALRNVDPALIRPTTAARIRMLIDDEAYATVLRPLADKLAQLDNAAGRVLRKPRSNGS
ncbi:MAG: P-loop NTPase fold protein [Caldiserica bacterium]|nr:P-loop NTPase fold protein [Caldisericota bacterium]